MHRQLQHTTSIDSKTKRPLANTVFTVHKQNGEVIKAQGNNGEFITNWNGIINLPTLENGVYYATEIKASQGYILQNKPKTFEVKNNNFT